jgi:hypothetical protein
MPRIRAAKAGRATAAASALLNVVGFGERRAQFGTAHHGRERCRRKTTPSNAAAAKIKNHSGKELILMNKKFLVGACGKPTDRSQPTLSLG